jgi:potassium channel subfamily K
MRRRLAVFTASWMLLGIMAGTQIEGWTLLTSFYVFVQIVTTIGYGDVTVDDQRMKLFMAFYVLVCILLVAGFFSDVINQIIQHESEAFMGNLKKAGDKADGVEVPAMKIFNQGARTRLEAHRAHLKVAAAGLVFMSFVVIGTVFYATQESCSCSYGATYIAGCIEAKCQATGGAMKGWIDSFYMSVITLTTVGFGDHSPKSIPGRIFGCFWMALGVGAFANFVAEFSKVFLTAQRKHRMKTTAQVFKGIDKDNSGFLGHGEFREFALLKWGLVTPEQLAGIDSLFKQIDKSGDNSVSLEELQLYCGR